MTSIRLFATTLFAIAAAGVTPAQTRPHFLVPTPMPLPVNMANTSSYSMALSADGLTAMVESDRPGGVGGRDLIQLVRPDLLSAFTSLGPMGFCTVHDERSGVFLLPLVVFSSNRPTGMGGFDLYASGGTGLNSLMLLLNSPWDDTDPSITHDGLEFFFTSNRPGSLGGRSIWHTTRASVSDPWGSPVALTSIDSANHEQSPSLTDDGLWLFFSSNRSGNFDIYAASRSTTQSPFSAPVLVAELSGLNPDIGISVRSPAGSDLVAFVTVMANGRAVILSADRDLTPFTGATELSASATVAPGDILSVLLESPAGHLGVMALGTPLTPIQTPFGLLGLDPGTAVVFDVVLQGSEHAHLAQVVLPAAPQLQGLVFALQSMGGIQGLQLSNFLLRTVQ